MKFHFRLEPVLRYRQAREEALKKELSQLIERAAKEQARLAQLEVSLQNQFAEWRAAQREQLNMELLGFLERHCERLRRERTAQGERVHRTQQAVERKRQEVVKASQEREVLERLREKRRMEFLTEFLRREQNVIDESAMQRYARSKEM
ncbi:MAG: flagellar export protein FliJ [Abditibacteriales bacterium]|nr:flagellar export protein FliJ [Abditibacteriales bacterium]MDW8365993.1 flagellar export protein FliJ [Abditibacteriales bacterium]